MREHPAAARAARPLRVLFLTTSYAQEPGDPSGPFVHRLAARLVAAGHAVTVVAPASPRTRDRREDGVDVRFFRYAPRRLQRVAHGAGIPHNLAADRRLAALVPLFAAGFALAARRLARGHDVVHAHWLPAGLVGRLAGRPLVVTAHGSDVALGARVPTLVRAAVGRGPVLAVTEPMADALRAVAPDTDVRVVPPQGIDVAPGPPGDPARVLFVGRLVPEKGIDVLAEAWPHVRAAHPGARLEVVGDGPLRPLLAALGEGVTLRGALPSGAVGACYGAAGLVVVPSRRDAFATVALEAMAHARPVVSTPVGALAARVRAGQDGLQVPVGDPLALAEAVTTLLADPARTEAMGRSAAERVEALYSWPSVLGRTLDAYRAALRRHEGRTASTQPGAA